MRERILTASSYGLCCFSVSVFTTFLQQHNQARTKQVATLLDKHKPLLEQALATGSFLPIGALSAVDYLIQVTQGRHGFADEWVEVCTLGGCNLRVGSEAAVWVSTTGALNEWAPARYAGQESLWYRTLDDELLYKAHKFAVQPGKYQVTLRGFKRVSPRGYPAVDFGFAYELSETQAFTVFTNPLLANLNIARL